jgi:hypothetical protein
MTINATSIRKKLRPSSLRGRWTTINGTAQLALGMHDKYSKAKVAKLLKLLEQVDHEKLACVFCGQPAQTWDHLHGNVKTSRFSGYGNRIFNLVPACHSCNQSKRNLHWREFARIAAPNFEDVERRLLAVEMENEAECYPWTKITERFPSLAAEYDQALVTLRSQVERLDAIAAKIRTATRAEVDKQSSPDSSATKPSCQRG